MREWDRKLGAVFEGGEELEVGCGDGGWDAWRGG